MSRHRPTAVIAVLCVALLLGGCELRAGVDVTVDGGGGGTFTLTLTADRQLQRIARRADADPLSDLAAAGRALDGWEVTDATEAPRTVTLRRPFEDPSDLAQATGRFADALAAPELRPLGPFRVDVTSDTVELRGTASLALTADTGQAATGVRARRALDDNVELRVTARMPGSVLRSNADEVDGSTATWTIPPDQQVDLRVVSERPWTLARVLALLGPWWPALALILAVIVVAAVLALRGRSARRSRTVRRLRPPTG